jgi:hypothetical protein
VPVAWRSSRSGQIDALAIAFSSAASDTPKMILSLSRVQRGYENVDHRAA